MPVFTNLRTAVQVDSGTRVRWFANFGHDVPWNYQLLKEQYGGAEATAVGFNVEYVGPLDHAGRLPGVYHKQDSILVRFDDGKEISVNPHHVLVISGGTLVEPPYEMASWRGTTNQRIGDLPEPIKFYQGDTVCFTEEHPRVNRKVNTVGFHTLFDVEGLVRYGLAATADELLAAESRQRKEREERPNLYFAGDFSNHAHVPIAMVEASQLELVEAGNVRRVYEDGEPVFASPGEALQFWSQSTFSTGSGSIPHIVGPREVIESGEADFILCDSAVEGTIGSCLVALDGSRCCCSARKLRNNFSAYQQAVRDVGLLVCERIMEVV
jgi:hypothetical protein